MKRTMAVAAAVSMLALFALASQAAAQGQPTASADPEYVSAAGEHTVTISGSGWQADPTITACTGFGGEVPAVMDQASTIESCPDLFADMAAPVSAPGGSFSASKTVNVPAEGLVILVFTAEPSAAALTVVKVGEMASMDDDMAEDMGDDMAPEGGADTGFGGTAGSDGNSVAVPLAATLAAVALLGGTALVARRHS